LNANFTVILIDVSSVNFYKNRSIFFEMQTFKNLCHKTLNFQYRNLCTPQQEATFVYLLNIFTALYGMQTRSSDENSVCPSVKRVHCDKTA